MTKTFIPLIALGLIACSEPVPEPASVPPADQAKRAEIGESPGDKFQATDDASFKELLCVNALGGPCPGDIDEQLAGVDDVPVNSRIDLVHQFVLLHAMADGATEVSDADYVEACYQVILGRSPDEGGFSSNLAFLSNSGHHRGLVESMLRSPEFRG